ncbi:ATP-binding protein [Trinickia sp. EG282A]|uniref:ATP-binding protein n=1 Tax=Trinickia sp. EG282A TaxID=3237013 RepID=UPI0034D2FF11
MAATSPVFDGGQIFHRKALGERLARQVLHVSPTSASSSGLFLAAPRRTGKTTFVRADFAPALETLGARVIYVDLWADRKADPGEVIVAAIRTELTKSEFVVTKIAKSLGITGAKIGSVDFSLDRVGLGKDVSLVQALAALSDDAKGPIVLIIDEAQQAITTQTGNDAMFSLKAARDELNAAHFGLRVVCTGSNRDKLAMLRSSKDQAFFGAPLIDFPPLDEGYVKWFCDNTTELPAKLSPEVVTPLFREAGNRPEILGAAADQLRFDLALQPGDVERRFSQLVEEQIAQANDDLLEVFHSLTPIQSAVLRVLAAAGKGYAPFESRTMEKYRVALGGEPGDGELSSANVQQALAALQEKGLVWRASRGVYAMEDHSLSDLLRREGYLEGL